MISIERELDRALTLLRNNIHDKGFTQLEVQEVLGWGRSYISQLLTKQKSLRLEQVLLILNVIGVDSRTFFSELYDGTPRSNLGQSHRPKSGAGLSHQKLKRLTSLLNGLVKILIEKRIITAVEISRAVRTTEVEHLL